MVTKHAIYPTVRDGVSALHLKKKHSRETCRKFLENLELIKNNPDSFLPKIKKNEFQMEITGSYIKSVLEFSEVFNI